MANVNEMFRDVTIKRAHFIDEYTNSEVAEILKLMNKMDAQLYAKLKEYPPFTLTAKRITAMRNDVRDIMEESEEILRDKMHNIAKDFGKTESDWVVDTLKDIIPIEIPVSFTRLTPERIFSAIRSSYFENTTMDQMISEWSRRKKLVFQNAIKQGYLQGQNGDEIVTNLFGTKKFNYVDGLINAHRRTLETEVRTSLNHMSNVAREQTFRKNSVVKGVQYVATLDSKTSLICINLDGKVELYDKSVDQLNGLRPPQHRRCRSTVVPIIKSLKELGLSNSDYKTSTRASMNGQVSQKETYTTWFKKQNKTFQREVLGKSRYELYKGGEFELENFTANNKRLTLKQLQNK